MGGKHITNPATEALDHFVGLWPTYWDQPMLRTGLSAQLINGSWPYTSEAYSRAPIGDVIHPIIDPSFSPLGNPAFREKCTAGEGEKFVFKNVLISQALSALERPI